MATLNVYVSTTPRRIDGKYEISIRITQYQKHAYLGTGLYVVKQQLSKDGRNIKDTDVQLVVLKKKKRCEDILTEELGDVLSSYSAKDIKSYLQNKLNKPVYFDFISFAEQYINELLEDGEKSKKESTDRNKKEKRAKHIRTTLNAFKDKFGNTFNITEFQFNTLEKFEKYLRSDRIITRKNQFGNDIKISKKTLTNTGVHDYMIDLQCIFNSFIKKNPEFNIINPFKTYTIPSTSISEKRNTDIEKIRRIFNYKGKGRAKLGRDCYILSLFLVGINSVDLYEMKYSCLEDGRLNYNRSKTSDRRPDKAFISINIEPEADGIMNQYTDDSKNRVFSFYNMYSNADIFNIAINRGLKKMREDINSDIDREIALEKNEGRKKELEKQKLDSSVTYYSARHSWATIVRNTLGYSKYIVAECLNHSIDELRTTDRYIEKTFTWIDEINRKMIDLVIENSVF